MINFVERIKGLFGSRREDRLGKSQRSKINDDVSESASDLYCLRLSVKSNVRFGLSHRFKWINTKLDLSKGLPIKSGDHSEFDYKDQTYSITCISSYNGFAIAKLSYGNHIVKICYPTGLSNLTAITPLALFMTNIGSKGQVSYNHFYGDKHGCYWCQIYDYDDKTKQIYSRRTSSLTRLVKEYENYDLVEIKKELDQLPYVDNAFGNFSKTQSFMIVDDQGKEYPYENCKDEAEAKDQFLKDHPDGKIKELSTMSNFSYKSYDQLVEGLVKLMDEYCHKYTLDPKDGRNPYDIFNDAIKLLYKKYEPKFNRSKKFSEDNEIDNFAMRLTDLNTTAFKINNKYYISANGPCNHNNLLFLINKKLKSNYKIGPKAIPGYIFKGINFEDGLTWKQEEIDESDIVIIPLIKSRNFSERVNDLFNFVGSRYSNPQVKDGDKWAHYIHDSERDHEDWSEFKDCDLIVDGTDEKMIHMWLRKNNMQYKVNESKRVPYEGGITIGYKIK